MILLARTGQVYRHVIDDAVTGMPFNYALLDAFDSLVSRGYTDGLYKCHHTHEQQSYISGQSESTNQQYVGDIVSCKNGIVELTEMHSLKGDAPGSGHRVRMPLQGELAKRMLTRFL